MNKFLVANIIIIIFIFGPFLHAGQTGKIAGKVTDAESGEPLPGTNVYIEGMPLGAATDYEGDYIILNVPPGEYTVSAMIVGYQEMKITGVNVSIDQTRRIDFALQSTVMETEAIVVEAEQPLVQKDLTATAAAVSAQEIAAIPVESLQDVLQLQAGIVVDANGEFHIRGGRSNEIAYFVDGVSVSDPFSGNIAVNINQEAIQELKVISGTFNAEYGKVMSGIVEVVTKDPENKFNAGATVYGGDYLSHHDELFYNIDDVNINDIYNLQVHLTGPFTLLNDKLSYYLSLRRFYNDGWLYGQRRFNPSDSSRFDPNALYIEQSGDSEAVAMNPSSQYFANLKLVFKLTPTLKLQYSFLGNYQQYRFYDHLYKLNPGGQLNNYEYGISNIFSLDHTLSSTSFYTVKLSHYQYDLQSYLHEDLDDSRYQNPVLLRNREDAYSFLTGGTNPAHFYRTTSVILGKLDFTSQVNKKNQIKSGIELRVNQIDVKNEQALYKGLESTVFSSETFFNRGQYTHNPYEFSAYIQDKIELDNMTLNIGLRYDYFNSDGKIPKASFEDKTAEGEVVEKVGLRDPQNAPKVEAEAKHQFSPRIGLAFPVSAAGVIHASYGHFFQIPDYEYLYMNPRFAVAPGGLNTLMGNANLKPQSTVIYEVGLQHEFLGQIGVDITGFYKDARNLLSTRIYETYVLGDRYARYENRDYGNIKGITFSVNKRPTPSDYITVSFDYTYQIAEGNASDPNHAFYNSQADPPKQSNIQVVPLDWDQAHTVNLSVSYHNPGIISAGLIGQFQSGLPYTPAIQSLETTFENSGRKPFNYNVDMRVSREFQVGRVALNVFLKIYNLFDRKNELTVYNDTGRAGYSLVSRYLGERQGHVNSLDEWLLRPDFYSEPRRVIIGMTINL